MFSLSAPPWRPSPAVRRCEDASATIAITSAHLPLAWHLLVPLSLHNAYRSPACCLTLFRALSDCCLLVGFVPLLFLLWLNLQHMSGYPPPSPHTHTHTHDCIRCLAHRSGPNFRKRCIACCDTPTRPTWLCMRPLLLPWTSLLRCAAAAHGLSSWVLLRHCLSAGYLHSSGLVLLGLGMVRRGRRGDSW